MAQHRYNSPPNWPAPPDGWTPPKDWAPDPAWGPAPDGWQFWVPAGGSSTEGRPNRSAWGRAAVVTLVLCALLGIVPFAAGFDEPAVALGAIMGRGLMVYLITAAWAFFSKRPWGWTRYAVTAVALTLLLAAIAQAGTT